MNKGFKNFNEVRSWIEDNKLQRYVFRLGRGETRENNYIFQYDQDASPEANMAMLEKRLDAHAGTHLYGCGFRNASATSGGIVCEVEYGQDEDTFKQYFEKLYPGVGRPLQHQVDPDELERRITEKVETRFKLEKMEQERKDFEKEKKEFEAEKQSAIGAIIQYFAPVAQAFLQQKGLAKVAGADVAAEKIVPVSEEEKEETAGPELPDDEAQKAYALLLRFREVEPRYLELIESVVTMAENGDSNYQMARSFLIKG